MGHKDRQREVTDKHVFSFNSKRHKLLLLLGGLPALIVSLLTRGTSDSEMRRGRFLIIGVIVGSWIGGISLGLYGWLNNRGSSWEGVLALYYGFFGLLIGTLLGALTVKLYQLYNDRKRG